MSDVEHINPETLPSPRGYTQVVRSGSTVHISGQVSVSADGTLVGRGDPEAQVRQVWCNLEAAVRAAGGTLRDIVKTTTCVTSRDCLEAVRKVRADLYRGAQPPGNTLLLVSGLANPDYLVEVEAIAVIGP